MRQKSIYNWLALLGMFVVVVLVVIALSKYGSKEEVANDDLIDPESVEVVEEYSPELKEVEEVKQSETEEVAEVVEHDQQEEIIIEGGSFDASIEENSDTSTNYGEDYGNANFDEKD